MKPAETKAEFIELRAQGLSYGKIAEQLKISKATCTSWEQELSQQIAERKSLHLEELYSLYDVSKENRIKRLGGTLNRINEELEKRNFSLLSTDKLIELQLKYEQALKAEHTAPAPEMADNTLESALALQKQILSQSQSGELTPSQVKVQLATIEAAKVTISQIENRDHPFSFGI